MDKEGDAKRLMQILENLPEMKSRELRMREIASYPSYDDWYTWLINTWIPEQPDYKNLMELFILLGFNDEMFIYALYGRLNEYLERSVSE